MNEKLHQSIFNTCKKFHQNQWINKGVTIQDGRQMDYILCFSGSLLFITQRWLDL